MTGARITWALVAFIYAAACADGLAGWAVYWLGWYIGDFVMEITGL